MDILFVNFYFKTKTCERPKQYEQYCGYHYRSVRYTGHYTTCAYPKCNQL